MKASVSSYLRYVSIAFILAGLCVAAVPSVGAQIVIGQPVIEIDKKIVTFDDTGQPVEADDLGEVLVGTPIFFRYRVSYTGYITDTVPVTGTVTITETLPVEIDYLAIRDDMGTLNPEHAFNCILTTLPITGTIPVATTASFTTTLPVGGTVIFTDTVPFLPGDVFECASSSGVISDTQTVFTPRSDGGYVNTAVATIGPCVEDCEPSDSDTASYVGLYWAFTPGFWKNHTGDRRSRGHDAWAYTDYDPNIDLKSVFLDAVNFFDGVTLLDALRFKGGKGDEGAARILLRAGVAALLNASFHEKMNDPVEAAGKLLLADGRTIFPYTSDAIVEMVNGLLIVPNRSAMLLIAKELDDVNDGIHYIDWNWVPPLP